LDTKKKNNANIKAPPPLLFLQTQSYNWCSDSLQFTR
jgi:hypothetical protein